MLSPGLSSALLAGLIRSNIPGTPENLSVFFVPLHDMNSPTIHHLEHHLKSVEGNGQDAVHIKQETKQRIIFLQKLQEYFHQISHFFILLNFLFGGEAIKTKSFHKLVHHAAEFET